MTIPVPTPARGQVLVKIECAPINPSDTYALGGQYSALEDIEIKLPFVPGWEGAGTVI